MLVANDRHNQRILGWKAIRHDGPFTCPGCGEEVLLRKGEIKIHHFAHRADRQCNYGAGESEKHRVAKEGIYRVMDRRQVPAVLEAQLVNQRPDILVLSNKQMVAIEVQVSSLSLDEIYRRTMLYAEKNIYVLWIVCEPVPSEGDVFRPKYWQKYLHGMYFGRIYYYWSHDLVIPVHLERGSGASRIARLAAKPLILSDENNFRGVQRQKWSYSKRDEIITIPQAKIWLDTLEKWWG